VQGHQLDLFLDSRDVILTNELVAALAARDVARSAQCLARLRTEAPRHADLPAFERLEAFLQLVAAGGIGGLPAKEFANVLAALVSRVLPAGRVLGAGAADFGRFFWLQMARAATHPFDPARPQMHAAELLLRAEAYEAVEEEAMAIAGAGTDRSVLRWLALARYRRHGLNAALWSVLLLAWRAPEALADLLREIDEPRLTKVWRALQSEADDPDARWFPAWLLLCHPESVPEADPFLATSADQAAAALPPARAFVLLRRILELERDGHSRALVDKRASLQSIEPGFFAFYMRSRQVKHG
jgi:hypothetical protein